MVETYYHTGFFFFFFLLGRGFRVDRNHDLQDFDAQLKWGGGNTSAVELQCETLKGKLVLKR